MIAALFFALGALVSSASAITTPDSVEMTRLQGLMDAAKSADGVYQDMLIRVQDGRLSELDARVQRDARTRAWTIAMHQTLIAYGMAFPDPDNPSLARLPAAEMLSGPHKGKVRPWVLAFSDLPLDQIIINSRDPKEFAEWERHRGEANAVTMFDGTTVVFAGDFKTPAHLARTLFHELRHYQQFADPKFRNSTLPEREADAYKQVLGNIEKFGFDSTTDELKRQRKYAGQMVVKKEREAITARGQLNLKNLRRSINRVFGWERDVSGYEESTLEGVMVAKEALAGIREESDRIRRKVETDADERREREAGERGAPNSGPRRSPEQVWADFDSLTGLVCRGDRSITDPIIIELRETLREVPTGVALADYDAMETTVSCPDYVRNRILLGRQRGTLSLDFQWLSRTASEGRRRERDPWPRDWPRAAPPPPVAPTPPPPAAPPKPPPPSGGVDFPEPRGGRAPSSDPCAESGTFGGVSTGCIR